MLENKLKLSLRVLKAKLVQIMNLCLTNTIADTLTVYKKVKRKRRASLKLKE